MSNIRIQDLERSLAQYQVIMTDTGGVPTYTSLSTSNITEGSNLYYTDARVRNAISQGNGIDYDPATGIISISSIGIEIDPIFSASPAYGISSGDISNWNTAYTDATGLVSRINYTTCVMTDTLSLPSINFNGRGLYSISVKTLDWENGLLFDGSAEPSINWTNRTLRDSSNFMSLDWDNRLGYTSYATSTIDWENGILYFNDGFTPTINWQNQQSFDSSGVLSIDWANRKLYDASGIQTFDWTTSLSLLTLYDHLFITSLDVDNRLSYDSFEIQSIDWNNRYLFDVTGSFPTIDWGDFMMRDDSGVMALTWKYGQRKLINSSGNLVLDWDATQTFDSSEVLSIDWNNRWLIDSSGSNTTVDWDVCSLVDGFGYRSMDWAARYTYNTGGVLTMDYNNGYLIDSSGSQPSLDWISRWFYDSTGVISLQWDAGSRILVDDSGSTSLQWGSRVAFDSTLLVSFDYQNRYMYDTTGVTISVDWGGRTLRSAGGADVIQYGGTGPGLRLMDLSAAESINWSSRYLNSALTSSPSVYWDVRQLADAPGHPIIDWATTNTLKISTGVTMQFIDTYSAGTISPTAQTPSTTNGYGNTTVGVLGQPTGWFYIKDSGGSTRAVPYY